MALVGRVLSPSILLDYALSGNISRRRLFDNQSSPYREIILSVYKNISKYLEISQIKMLIGIRERNIETRSRDL